MKAEHRVLLASGSALGGAIAEETLASVANDNKLAVGGMAAAGVVIAILGFVTKMDGVSDAAEAGGLGAASLAILRLLGVVS